MARPTVRVRFAPSPTGHLHVGGARTAIYNWLFARHNGGTFILRIDDTDPERSLPEYTEAILRGMRWLGLDWEEGPDPNSVAGHGSESGAGAERSAEVGQIGDHGPYCQSQKAQRYADAAEQLVETMNAYRCYCSPEELEGRRQEALAAKKSAGYDRRCRFLRDEERAHLERDGVPYVIRFAVPLDGETSYDDAIRGRLSVENVHVEDFVIVRSDGTPTYNFASTVDDVDMAITHVIRGDDHMSNTPKQIMLLEALGAAVPTFAHLPMIWGSDKTRLSKRHGATSVEAYRDAGYLPEALVNFLALLGWSADAATTVFSRDELVAAFTLERVSSSPAIFDPDKLDWMNGEYIRGLTSHDFLRRAWPFLEAAGLTAPLAIGQADIHNDKAAQAWWSTLADMTRERLKRLDELPELVRFLFEEVPPDETATAKALADPAAGAWIAAAADALEGLEPFEGTSIEETLRALPARLEIKPKALFAAVRAAVTGRLISTPLFGSIELLGAEHTLRRLRIW